MALDVFKNFATATLAATLPDASTTTFTVSSGHGLLLPATPFNAVVWNSTDYATPDLDPSVEVVRVTTKATDTLTVARAQEGTTGVTHNTGGKTYKLLATVTAGTLNSGRPVVLYNRKGGSAITPVVSPGTSALGTAFTIPANALQAEDWLRIEFWANHTGGTSNAMLWRITLGGTTVFDMGDGATGTGMHGVLDLFVISSSSQAYESTPYRSDAVWGFPGIGTHALDLTTALALDIRAYISSGTTTEQVQLRQAVITLTRSTS